MVALGLILIFITKLLSKQICLCHYLFRVEPGLIRKVDASTDKAYFSQAFYKTLLQANCLSLGEPQLNPSLFLIFFFYVLLSYFIFYLFTFFYFLFLIVLLLFYFILQSLYMLQLVFIFLLLFSSTYFILSVYVILFNKA